MNRIGDSFIAFMSMIAAVFYVKAIICMFRSLYLCVPVMLVWNRVISEAAGTGKVSYWGAYWICSVFMYLISSPSSVISKTK